MGLYCDPRVDVRVRDNVKLIAKEVWNEAPESARGECGVKYSNFAANADIERKKFAQEFLDLVDGLSYLPANDLALSIHDLTSRLEAAHDGWDNFYNEPPIARQLKKFVPGSGDIPHQVNDEYVRVLVRCRVGRRSGVARNGVPIYDELLELFTVPQLKAFVHTLEVEQFTCRLDDSHCAERFHAIAKRLSGKVVGNALRRVFDAIAAATPQQLPKLAKDHVFRKLLDAI